MWMDLFFSHSIGLKKRRNVTGRERYEIEAAYDDDTRDDQASLAREPPPGSLATVVMSASLRRFVYLATDSRGVPQAFVENSDGTAVFALTSLPVGEYAAGLSLSG